MKNITQISLATMAGIAIWVFSTFSLFATDVITFPDLTPDNEATGWVFTQNFEKIFTSCAGSGLALGYSGTTKNLECITMMDLRKLLLSWSIAEVGWKACRPELNEFLVGFSSTGALICQQY